MKETIYFRHDYDAHADPKMVKLRMKYGREGYGMFWAMLEVMRSDADIVINLCDIDAIAYRLHCECDAMKNMMDYFAEIGLLIFDKKDQSYYSERLQSDVEYMREKSKKAKDSAHIRRSAKKHDDANALQSQSEGNAIKDKIRKENKIKDKKEKERKEYNNINIPSQVRDFIDTQAKNMISIETMIKKQGDNYYSKNAIDYEKMKKEISADVGDAEVIAPAILQYIPTDDFWKTNIGSINKLLQKNSQGIKYRLVILERIKQIQDKRRSYVY